MAKTSIEKQRCLEQASSHHIMYILSTTIVEALPSIRHHAKAPFALTVAWRAHSRDVWDAVQRSLAKSMGVAYSACFQMHIMQ